MKLLVKYDNSLFINFAQDTGIVGKQSFKMVKASEIGKVKAKLIFCNN